MKTRMIAVRAWRWLVRLAGRVPRKAWIAIGLLGVGVAIGVACLVIISGRYQLSAAENRLLGKSDVAAAELQYKDGNFTYNMAADVKDDTVKKVVAAASENDSTPQAPYRATLAKDSSRGLTFGDARGDLSFAMVPGHGAMNGRVREGRVVYPTVTGSKSVYTFKRNGIKEDILLNHAPAKTVRYSWKLDLGDKLVAKQLPDGSIGIYSASPHLFGDLQISDDKSRKLIENARKKGEKTNLVFALPQPFIVDAKGRKNFEDVSYSLKGDVLTLEARNLYNKRYPLSIDPTVVVTTTADFRSGLDDGMVDYTTTSNQIARAVVSQGAAGTFTTNTNYFTEARYSHTTLAYNGYLYITGGQIAASSTNCKDSGTSQECNDIQYAAINANGSIGTFTTNSNYFSFPRLTHTAVAYNGYMYIMGGDHVASDTNCKDSGTSNLCNDIQYAPISGDGSVGTFTTNSNYFSFPRAFFTAQAYNGYLYIVGGYIGTSSTNCKNSGTSTVCNDIQYAPIKADGSIGTFTTNSNYFSTPRQGLATTAYNGFLYVFGGNDSTSDTDCAAVADTKCNDVQYAAIGVDGSVGSFTTNSTTFSIPRTTHAGLAYSGYLYVTGGAQTATDTNCKNSGSSKSCNDTQYAPIYPNGSVGAFTTNTNYFADPRSKHGSIAYNGYLYVVGGIKASSGTSCRDSGTSSVCNDVQYAAITATGTGFGNAGTWTRDSDYISIARYNHKAVAYNGYLYIIGGRQESSDTNCKDSGSSVMCNDIQYAAINANGSINALSTESDHFSYPRNYFGALAYDGYLYIIGGEIASSTTDCKDSGTSTLCNDVQYAAINSDGSIGAFSTDSDHFSYPRYGLATVAYNGYLYVIGGSIASSTTDCKDSGTSLYCNDVQYAAINSDGSIGSFSTDTDHFATPRYRLGAAAHNGYLYVTAGDLGSSSTACKSSGTNNFCSDTQYAAINAGGSIGAFANTSYFAFPRASPTVFAYNGYLYVGGGNETNNDTNCKDGDSSSYCNDIVYAPFNSNGTIGSYTEDTIYFSVDRTGLAGAAHQGYFYITGGLRGALSPTCRDSGSSVYCNDVQYAASQTPDNQAVYERVLAVGDTGTNIRLNSVVFNGQAVCGIKMSYRTAATSGSFGSTTTLLWISPGETISLDQLNKQYLWVKYTLMDQNCGTQSNITDITLTWSYDPPDAPTLSTPANNAIGVSNLPQIQMRSPQANNSYLRYKIEVCTTSNCSSVLRTIDQTASQTGWTGQDQQASTAYTGNAVITSSTMASHTYQTPVLSWNTQYWWRAYVIDPAKSNTFSSASGIYTFYTNFTPTAPTLISPASNATGVSVTPDLRLASTDQDSDYIRYKIEVCSTSNCSSVVRTIDQTASQTGWQAQSQQSGTAYSTGQEASHVYQPAALSASTQYWWRGYAIDPGGTNLFSSASSISSFTTGASPRIDADLRGGTTIKGGSRL